MNPTPSDEDYRRLLELRTGLRRFLRWSEQQAETAGVTPAQHQLLLAIRGHPDERGPTIGDAAGYLLLRHHSVVGLVDRAENAGLIERQIEGRVHRFRLRRKPLQEAGDWINRHQEFWTGAVDQLERLLTEKKR